MSIEDGFIKDTAQALEVKEDLVDRIIRHQWKTTKEATLTGTIIEISGLGRLQTRTKQVQNKIKVFTNYFNAATKELADLDKDTDTRWYPTYKKVQGLEKDLNFLNNKKIIKKYGMEKNSTGNI